MDEPKAPKRPVNRRQKVLYCTWAVLLLFFAYAYFARPDELAAIFIWPAWVWMFFAAPFGFVAGKGAKWKTFFQGSFLWLMFSIVFWGDWKALISWGSVNSESVDAEFRSAQGRGLGIRIVSLNCAGGQKEVAEEALDYHPDIILLQEALGEPECKALAKKAFGERAGWVVGPDCAILAREPLHAKELPRETSDVVVADVGNYSPRLTVASLRLTPPTLRFDYWNPDCWRDYAENRRIRREELKEVWRLAGKHTFLRNLVVGGDFNTPPDPPLFALLAETHKDAFADAGAGWGATAVNPYPLVVRIDQIWVPKGWQVLRCFAAPSRFSDHRMVVADVVMDPTYRTLPPISPQRGGPQNPRLEPL